MKEGRKASPPPEASEFQIKAADAAMFASPRPVRVAAATGHGEWSRRDARDIDGLSREVERSGSE